MVDHDEFLVRPDVVTALDELIDVCFAHHERGSAQPGLPDPVEFLHDRGLDVPRSCPGV